MEKKEENNTEINQSFKLSAIVGIWESLNLHPTVMIYPSKKKYFSMYLITDRRNQPFTRYRKKITVTSSLKPLNGFISAMMR